MLPHFAHSSYSFTSALSVLINIGRGARISSVKNYLPEVGRFQQTIR